MRSILLALGVFLVAARPAAALILNGKVLETAEDETYTFALIDTAVGEKWAAVPRTKLAKGDSLDKDMGAGYKFPVLLEGATIVR